jgi:uncharacterized protein with HEPN domain
MAAASPISRLSDIIGAIELIRSEMAGVTLQAFEHDIRKCWFVQRGREIISEASRHLPDAITTRHHGIAWPKVAGIGNVLRHDYEHVADDVLWHVVVESSPPVKSACRSEFGAAVSDQHEGP